MTDIKEILHTLSDQSDAETANLWYGIEAELKEQNLMKKKKGTPRRLNLGLIAALIGVIVLGSIAFGMATREVYYPVTLDNIREMATVINESHERDNMTVTVDWAYADPTQIVVAYSMTDSDGNPIPIDAVDDGFVEFHVLWQDGDNRNTGEYSAQPVSPRWYLGRDPLYADGTTGQQVVRFTGTRFHFDMIQRLTENEFNLNERTTLPLRIVVQSGSGSELFTSFTVPFEVPYDVTLFQEHNDFVTYDPFDPENIPSEQLEVFFDHLVVAESGIAAKICYHFPEDHLSGNYFPDDLQLYVDGTLVETVAHNQQFDVIPYTPSDKVELHTRAWFSVTQYYLSCSDYVWNIGFETLPDEIRIALPALNFASTPVAFDSLEQLETYADLFQEEGYAIDVSVDETYLMNSDAYPDAYHDLDQFEQYAIQMRVLEQFYEIYPPEMQFTGDWSYTFDLTQ